MSPTAALRPAATDPAVDLRLACLHLRMGQLGLARAALEALAGSGDLDEDGLLALAEARWRTGDLTGAGDAAEAYLASGGEATVALVIAAEAIAAAGRPGEARRFSTRVLEREDIPLDRLFAGMPRSALWPADPAQAGQAAAARLFGGETGARQRRPPLVERGTGQAATAAGSSDDGKVRDDRGETEQLPQPSDELESGRLALAQGHRAEAALRFALALRESPELAPAVLTATEPRDARSPEIEIVRGDAFRMVGHELDARRAYVQAAGAIADRRSQSRAGPGAGGRGDPTIDPEERT